MASTVPQVLVWVSGRPHRTDLALEFLQAMADVSRLLGRAFRVDQHRQIAGDAGRIHVVEEVGAMAAEQILHIVLGGRQHHVDAGLIHQAIKAIVIEGDREPFGRLSVDVHDAPPWSPDSTEA